MSLQPCSGPHFHFRIHRSVAALLTMLVVLAWSSPVFGDEIHDAAQKGDLAVVQALLKSNPNLALSKDNLGAMPLHWAARMNHKDVAELLLANNADVNAKLNDGATALDLAAGQGYKELVELLLANKADANAKDNNGNTPLHYAANRDDQFAIKTQPTAIPYVVVLVKDGKIIACQCSGASDEADIQQNRPSAPRRAPSPTARIHGEKEAWDEANLHGTSEAYVTFHRTFPKSMRLIVRTGALKWGDTTGAVHAHNDPEQGPGPNVLDGVTIGESSTSITLREAVILGLATQNEDVTGLLLASKADVNARGNDGRTALHVAARKGNKDASKLLLTSKANVNAKANDGKTPLHYAAGFGHKDVVELLLASKADVNAVANDGKTPLRYASDYDHKDVAELLRQHGGHE
jgi:ankyrin repeat protein